MHTRPSAPRYPASGCLISKESRGAVVAEVITGTVSSSLTAVPIPSVAPGHSAKSLRYLMQEGPGRVGCDCGKFGTQVPYSDKYGNDPDTSRY